MVSFLPGRSQTALSRFTAVEFVLDKVHVDVYACRVAIYHTSDSRSVTFTETRQPE
jgi:N-acetylglucosamine-6-phosphate deacetylase